MAKDLISFKKELKEGKLDNLYLFYGKEQYYAEYYARQLAERVPDGGMPEFNRMTVEDDRTPVTEIDDFIETYPLMSERKLLTLKHTGLMKSPKEEQKSYWSEKLKNLPDYLTVLILETEIDKRSVLYKTAAKLGSVVEFGLLNRADAVTWVIRHALDEKKKISKENAAYLVDLCDEGLSSLKNELDKLTEYCGKEILKSDIERVVSKSLQIRIFEMTDALTTKQPEKVLSLLNDLKTSRESAFRVLYVLSNTFDQLLHCRLLLSEGANTAEIGAKIKVAPFVAKKLMQNANSFSEHFLVNRVQQTAQLDLAIKEGKISEWNAVEDYVTESLRMI